MLTEIFRPGCLNGTVAFVTGGGGGLNYAIAEALARLGASIGICGRTAEKLDAAHARLSALGASCFAHVADVRDEAALADAIDGCHAALGPINFLVCGAAGNFVAPAERISSNGFRTVIEIDLIGAFHACRLAFDQLKQTKGSILFVSGGQAFVPFAYQAHVGAAKAGIDNMMANLALEWGKYGIRANSIVPGPIARTVGMQVLGGEATPGMWEEMVPLGRMGTSEEIGQVAAFLASPLASYISGARLTVDGGQNLTGSIPFNRAVGAQFA